MNRIANWEDLAGFPRHLRVLHVKQEMHTENEETTVLDAVLESDVERMTLLKEEKEILARLESIPQQHDEGDDNDGGASTTTSTTAATTTTIEERQKLLASDDTKFGDDLKKLKDIYERLTTLGADTAESRAIAILTGLQFTEAMQRSPLKSLSGGWRMRTALAAALLIEPDLLMLGKKDNELFVLTYVLDVQNLAPCVPSNSPSSELLIDLYPPTSIDEPTNHLDLEAVLYLESTSESLHS